jgi:hypothetical protein
MVEVSFTLLLHGLLLSSPRLTNCVRTTEAQMDEEQKREVLLKSRC